MAWSWMHHWIILLVGFGLKVSFIYKKNPKTSDEISDTLSAYAFLTYDKMFGYKGPPWERENNKVFTQQSIKRLSTSWGAHCRYGRCGGTFFWQLLCKNQNRSLLIWPLSRDPKKSNIFCATINPVRVVFLCFKDAHYKFVPAAVKACRTVTVSFSQGVTAPWPAHCLNNVGEKLVFQDRLLTTPKTWWKLLDVVFLQQVFQTPSHHLRGGCWYLPFLVLCLLYFCLCAWKHM